MVDLSVKLMGIKMKNPLLIAPGMYVNSFTQLKTSAKRIADAGWGGIIPKPISFEEVHPCPSLSPLLWSAQGVTAEEKMMRKLMFLMNAGPGSYQLVEKKEEKHKIKYPGTAYVTREEGREGIKAAKNAGLTVIPCLQGSNPHEVAQLAKLVEEYGADAVEYNGACPMLTEAGTVRIALNPEMIKKFIKEIKKEISIPLSVKISPYTMDAALLAKEIEAAGADGITAVNTILGILGVDVETGDPVSKPAIGGPAVVAGLSGVMLRPMGLRFVWEVARATKLSPIGLAGASNWKNVVEYLMLGANAVAFVTAVMWHGLGIARDILKGMEEFMERKGYSKVEDFIGISVPRLVHLEEKKVDTTKHAIALVNETKCTGCGLCVTSCRDNSYDAIEIKEGVAIVDENKCIGCGLCGCVCPVLECITYRIKD